jgi:hypothetical protein
MVRAWPVARLRRQDAPDHARRAEGRAREIAEHVQLAARVLAEARRAREWVARRNALLRVAGIRAEGIDTQDVAEDVRRVLAVALLAVTGALVVLVAADAEADVVAIVRPTERVGSVGAV